jgi:dephospho-CoA kinase
MKVVGLTGGIGSGKTTVAMMFKKLGIPVYIADEEAKKIMVNSKVVRRKLIQLLGEKAYTKEGLNKTYIASQIFTNPEKLKQVNAIIHPKVGQHFKRWLKKQKGPYVIKESAILFESGAHKDCDKIILVTAPLNERIKRVILRDKTTEEAVLNRIENQMKDTEKAKLSDFIIENKNLDTTYKKVLKIHNILSNL